MWQAAEVQCSEVNGTDAACNGSLNGTRAVHNSGEKTYGHAMRQGTR